MAYALYSLQAVRWQCPWQSDPFCMWWQS